MTHRDNRASPSVASLVTWVDLSPTFATRCFRQALSACRAARALPILLSRAPVAKAPRAEGPSHPGPPAQDLRGPEDHRASGAAAPRPVPPSARVAPLLPR